MPQSLKEMVSDKVCLILAEAMLLMLASVYLQCIVFDAC